MSTTIWKRTGAFVMIGSMLAVNASAVAQQKPQDPDHPYAGSVTVPRSDCRRKSG